MHHGSNREIAPPSLLALLGAADGQAIANERTKDKIYKAAKIFPNSSAASGPFPVTINPSFVTDSSVKVASAFSRKRICVPSPSSQPVTRLPFNTPAAARMVGAMQMAPSD